VATPSPTDAVTAAAGESRWALRWRGWADWPLSPGILVLAALTVILDATTAWTGTSLGSLGRIPVSPGLPLAVLLVARIGAGRLGWSRRDRHAWRELAVGLGGVLVLATVGYAATLGRPVEAVGLVLAGLGEELVFRLAAVVVLGALAARLLGRDWRNPKDWGAAPGFFALAAAAVVFTALPGHVEQMTNPVTMVSFASLALVLGYTVLRTGAIWPAAMVHALVDLVTLAAWQGAGAPGLRVAIAALSLLALVAGADVAGRRLGLRVRLPAVIDLRAAARETAAAP
jgi:membrane protease YdiL (CAAX protease family)